LKHIIGSVWLIEPSIAEEWAALFNSMLAGNPVQFFDDNKGEDVAAMQSMPSGGAVMVMNIAGPIMKYDFCGSAGTQTMMAALQAAQNNPAVNAIVLAIDSPGGSVDGTEMFAKAIKESKKPVVAYVSDLTASAAYWLASQTSEIVLSGETARVGSIGTMATLRKGSSEAYVTLYASKSTRKNKAYTDAMNGDTETYVKNVLDPLNEVFIDAVMSGRGDKIDVQKEDVTEGDIYFGSNAVKVGLADKIGNLDYAIKRAYALSKTIR
jgi:protease-4